ncbi:unknown [Feldmannia species virus]|uniref:Uncharacterized protein n=1 Tax=Feldmannia species virus TaxID=39420 RepID=B5LWA5_9PHYC|nr:hypothetical protein FeldSpV_gp016 [Feldmannia species virus]ACH46768.1 unknown [Feldmannia species virus]
MLSALDHVALSQLSRVFAEKMDDSALLVLEFVLDILAEADFFRALEGCPAISRRHVRVALMMKGGGGECSIGFT